MDAILVINAGSSSIKFATFEQPGSLQEPRLIANGHVVRVESDIELRIKGADGTLIERSRTASLAGGHGNAT